MDYIEKLKKIKERLFCNNSQLAVKLGVDRAQVTRWIDGKEPSYTNARKINKLYEKIIM